MRRLVICLLVAVLAGEVGLAQDALTPEQKTELGQYFGFGPIEIYRIKPGINNLHIADLNSDGRKDMVLWNAEQSRFELFFQPDPNAGPGEPAKLERNEVPDRGRHVRKNVPVNYKVTSVDIGDLSGDGKNDIVFFGEPRELVIVPQKDGGSFGAPEGIRAPEGNPRRAALALGDFNSDKRLDAAILGPEVLLIFLQREQGGLAPPLRLVHGIRNPTLMLRGDVNGDGRDDLLIGADDDRYGMYVCLQEPSGMLAALRPVRVPRHRSLTMAPPAAGQKGDDLYCVELATNRLMHYRWEMPKDPGVSTDWPQRLHSYPVKSSSKQRPLALGDVDGDGRMDCVTADPDAAQMILFRGEAGGLGAGQAFPGLLKASDVRIEDFDRDGRNEVLIVSGEEKTLAVSRYENGRLTFPAPLPTQGQPYVVAVGPLNVGAPADRFAYVTKLDGEFKLVVRGASDAAKETVIKIDDMDEDPAGLRFVDVDQNGLNDLLLFVRFSAPKVFVQQADGAFKAFEGADTRSSLLKEASPASFAYADVTGDSKPELLFAQEAFVRVLAVQNERWTVVDQINPETADAKIIGLAAIPGGDKGPTIVAYERKAGDLLVFKRRDDKTFGISQTMPVGAFDLTAMDFLAIGEKGEPAVLMADVGKLAVLRPQERAETLVVQHSYASDQKDAWLADAVIGDVNGDGVRDVIAVDMGKASIELLTTPPGGGFVRTMRFQVFQGRRFTDMPDTRGEPREVLIGELTGDAIDDLALIVHDRVIVYPGE